LLKAFRIIGLSTEIGGRASKSFVLVMALPPFMKAQISRELDRLELVIEQIRAIEAERDKLLMCERKEANSAVSMLENVRGIGPELASLLWAEGFYRHFDNRRQNRRLRGIGADAVAKRFYRSRSRRVEGRKSEAANHDDTGCLALVAASTRFSALRLVPTASSIERRSAAQKDCRCARTQTPCRSVEICDRRHRDRWRTAEECIEPHPHLPMPDQSRQIQAGEPKIFFGLNRPV
jgi:transposase